MIPSIPAYQLCSAAALPGTYPWSREHVAFPYNKYVCVLYSLKVCPQSQGLERFVFHLERWLTHRNLNTFSRLSLYPTGKHAATPLARMLSACSLAGFRYPLGLQHGSSITSGMFQRQGFNTPWHLPMWTVVLYSVPVVSSNIVEALCCYCFVIFTTSILARTPMHFVVKRS